MFIVAPQDRLNLANSSNEYILNMHLDSSKFYFENKDIALTTEQLNDAVEMVNSETNLGLSHEHMKAIFDIYPRSRIQFAIYKDTEGLFFAISHFFLGCSWPTYGDKVDIDAFYSLLNSQAKSFFAELA